MKFLKTSNLKPIYITVVGYIGAAIFILMGYHLIFVVNNSGIFDNEPYQYILNLNLANGYFIIALIFVLLGSTFAIIDTIKSENLP